MKKILQILFATLLFIPLAAMPARAQGNITIDATNFPDANFKTWLLSQTYGSDGILTPAEIAGITDIDVRNLSIADLTGIAYFTALEHLLCPNNNLTGLDLSANTELTDLECDNNNLTALDLSANSKLNVLSCGINQLQSLDMSANSELTDFWCYSNHITSLNVSGCSALVSLSCWGNPLSALDVSNNTALIELNCSQNQLTSLDLTNNTSLTPTYFQGYVQEPHLTLVGSGSSYSLAIDLNNPTILESGLTYSGGILTSYNKSITSSYFEVETNKAGFTLDGTMYLTYVDVVNAETPTIGTQPFGTTVTVGSLGATHNLNVSANVTDGGTLSYQWYSNTSSSTTGGTPVGVNSATFGAPIDATGTFYYYVVVTNTIPDNSDGGNKTATVTSNSVTVTVNPPLSPIINLETPAILAGDGWTFNGTDTYTITDDGVSITGTVTGATIATKFNIAAGKTATWTATMSGSANPVVALEGGGTLDIADGLVASSGNAISANDVFISVSGGTVTSGGSGSEAAIYTTGGIGSVTVSGGSVLATGNGRAINTTRHVTVTDGIICSTTGLAISASGSVDVLISGGAVFSYGTSVGDIIWCGNGFTAPSGYGAVIAWDNQPTPISYTSSTSDDLFMLPANVAWWDYDAQGIQYAYATNEGVINLTGVSVVKNPAIQDNADITDAKALIESTTFSDTQAHVSSMTEAKVSVEAMIAGLASQLNGVSATVIDGSFSAAIAGTDGNPTGTDGSYTFTVELNKGTGTQQTTISLNMTIMATQYSLSPVPIFDDLEDEYTTSDPPVTLAVIGEGAGLFTHFTVNGTPATQFTPSLGVGTYLIEALSADETLRIWKYVTVK